MEILFSFAGEVQSKRSDCKAPTGHLDAKVAKVYELEMKVGLLVDEAGKVAEMQ